MISLDVGWDVVADAQHANPEYANELARLATRHGAIWRTEDFDVPLDELLRRNEARPRADHVPEEYIRSSWKRFHHVMFRPLNPEDPVEPVADAARLERHRRLRGDRYAIRSSYRRI